MPTLDLRLSRLNSCKTVTHHGPTRVEINLAFLKCLEKKSQLLQDRISGDHDQLFVTVTGHLSLKG